MESVIVALVSVCLGWLLSQGTELVKSRRKVARIKKAILAELCDIKKYSDIAIEQCCEFRDSLGSNKYGVIVPQPIKSVIFDEHYVSVYADFSSEERFALGIVYGHVENFNSILPKITEDNVITCFGDLYSASLWLQASINQFQLHPKVHISLDESEVTRINSELGKYLKAVGLLK
ncbi:hypothetical protein P7F88_21350 [Vibrio hannami]|uniref:hypothetical protein n=1 Tax=Vibrio hannami TaxID=2717094 RepID=UPI00240EC99D|nr:hypothetical protein [Vibrio hannami]MDG3088469.1 hypothetical protein [Vibrio hannami]